MVSRRLVCSRTGRRHSAVRRGPRKYPHSHDQQDRDKQPYIAQFSFDSHFYGFPSFFKFCFSDSTYDVYWLPILQDDSWPKVHLENLSEYERAIKTIMRRT